MTVVGMGCDGVSAPVQSTPVIRVCATVYPLGEVVRQVGGSDVRLDWILDLGDPIEGYRLSREDRSRLIGIDLLVYGSIRSETWVQGPVQSLEETGRVFSLDRLDIARTAPTGGLLWTDPVIIQAAAPIIAEVLSRKMPERSDVFHQRARNLVGELDRIIQHHPNAVFRNLRVLVTSRSFDPFLDRFGVRSVLVEADPLNLSDIDIRRLRSQARTNGISVVLLPFDTPVGTIRDIEQRTGLRVYLIDVLGLANLPGHQTYQDLLLYNLSQLRQAIQNQTSIQAQPYDRMLSE
ncbi:MAG: hypothetical protein KatS3mg104_2554 [Phycisphaerae bacterium]|jgi:zinc transport system substrate-binding protein|nr:MAG: hypothetical protein KatS3mg104_2554 [Phycisphaerae bacterium]